MLNYVVVADEDMDPCVYKLSLTEGDVRFYAPYLEKFADWESAEYTANALNAYEKGNQSVQAG